MRFDVTYETITPESAEHGDSADHGFVDTDMTLRDALAEIGHGNHCEADSYPCDKPRWLRFHETNDGTRDYYETGTVENRTLHLPENITRSSARRIARLVGAYGF